MVDATEVQRMVVDLLEISRADQGDEDLGERCDAGAGS